jgi:hypothetical protein
MSGGMFSSGIDSIIFSDTMAIASSITGAEAPDFEEAYAKLTDQSSRLVSGSIIFA